MKQVYVKFKEKGKAYIFLDNDLNIKIGDNVIVNTEKGMQFGSVSAIEDKDTDKQRSLVIRIATKDDIITNNKNLDDAKLALEKATSLSKELKLDMKFIDCYYTFDRKQLIFIFVSDTRVDFRELAKQLANIYKTRIELRQVGVRDKAKEISGIGVCGRKLCCSCFLNDLDTVSISMVKNQNLSLNPSKINGPCGRLLCCLKYEDEMYKEMRNNLPELGKNYSDANGFEGKITNINILNETYTITDSNGESKTYNSGDKCEKCSCKQCGSK